MKPPWIQDQWNKRWIELATYARAWMPQPPLRFVVYCHYRAGSHLLIEPLRYRSGLQMDGEILLPGIRRSPTRMLSPWNFLRGSSAGWKRQGYGCVLRHSQLADVGANPRQFLLRLHQEGWKIVHLVRRDLLRLALSNLVALERNLYHVRRGREAPLEPVRLEPKALLRELQWAFENVTCERMDLLGIPNLRIVYEDDLLLDENRPETWRRLFEYLGLPNRPWLSSYRRTGTDCPRDTILNYDELLEAIRDLPGLSLTE